MFWISIYKNFSRISDAASRILAIPLSQALSERTFSQITCAQTPQQASQSEQHLEYRLFVKGKAEDDGLKTVTGSSNCGGWVV